MKSTPAKKDSIRYAAFLRGINVGGNTLIKMEDLKKEFAARGYGNVKTILASGNVIFDAPQSETLEQDIARLIEDNHGIAVHVVAIPIEELRDIVNRQPFKDLPSDQPTKTFATFTSRSLKMEDIRSPAPVENVRIVGAYGRVVCSALYERPGLGTLYLMAAIEKELGKKVTTRTWNTVLRMIKAEEKSPSKS